MINHTITKVQNHCQGYLYNNDLLPDDFFYFKEETTPKANPKYMYWFAVIGYLIGMITFVGLFISQSSEYTMETTIQTSDISDGTWTCSMASIQSKTIGISDEEPSQSYSLIQVNELKSQCQNNLLQAQPCQSPMLSGVITTSLTSSLNFLASGMTRKANNVVYLAGSGNGYAYAIAKYNYSDYSLTIKTDGFVPQLVDPNTIVIDTQGTGYFIYNAYKYNSYCGTIFTFNMTEIYCETCIKSLYNDNYLNIYTIINNMVYQLIPNSLGFGVKYISSLSYSIVANSFAIYRFSPTKTNSALYYTTFSPCKAYVKVNYTTYLLYNSTYTGSVYLEVDDNNNYLYMANPQASVGGILRLDLTKPLGTASFVLLNGTSTMYKGFMGSNIGAFNLLSSQTILYSSYISQYNGNLIQYIIDTSTSITIYQGYSGSHAGWFVCEGINEPILPSSELVYSQYCSKNGLIWGLKFANVYYATINEFTVYVTTKTQESCQANIIYPMICDTVGNLPPYVCSKKKYGTFFNITSTAIANSQFIMTFLFLCFGFLFEKYGQQLFPNQEEEENNNNENKENKENNDGKHIKNPQDSSKLFTNRSSTYLRRSIALEKRLSLVQSMHQHENDDEESIHMQMSPLQRRSMMIRRGSNQTNPISSTANDNNNSTP